ncbi:hypothetical protein Trydic_g9889 [Trypoxylus dichotomus]
MASLQLMQISGIPLEIGLKFVLIGIGALLDEIQLRITLEKETDYTEDKEKNEFEQSIIKEIEIQEENITIKDADEEIEEGTRKFKRNVHPPKYLEEFDLYTAYCLLTQQEDPKTYKDAAQDKEWNQAIEKELMAHKRFQTWEETDLPKGCKAIETRWVSRTKQDGLKKARLVRGY